MSKDHPELQKLLEIRAAQAPADEYFEEFLREFHRRQRQDLMKRSARSLFMERLSVWFREMGSAKWAYGAGLAYAVAMVGFFAWPKGESGHELHLPGDRALEGASHERIIDMTPGERKAEEEPSRTSEF